MRRFGMLLVALIAAFAFVTQSAEAGHRKRLDPRVRTIAYVAPAAATVGFLSLNNWRWNWRSAGVRGGGIGTGGAYALSAVGCAAASPIIATAVTGRELTSREAHVMVGSCFLPIVGGYIVNAMYDAHPHWEARRRR